MEELIQYFNEETSVYKNIHSKNKVFFWGLLFSPLIILLYPVFVNSLTYGIWKYLLLGIVILPCIIMYILFNSKTKIIIEKKYGINVKTFFWNSTSTINSIYSIDKNKIIEWLLTRGYYEKDKLEKIKGNISNIKNRKYIQFPVFPAIIGIILFPIWEKYLDKIFNEFTSPVNFTLLHQYIFIIIFLVIFFLGSIFLIKGLIIIAWELIINYNTLNTERLKKMLDDIIFELYIKDKGLHEQ